jgi:mannose-6-phosphate isomerase
VEPFLYPLRFEPIFLYRLWGGRRLAGLLTAPLPDGPVGEAWVHSDRDDHPRGVADGPLKERTTSQLLAQFPEQVMRKLAGRLCRFPLLLKFLDAREMLAVQVHPRDTHAGLLPAGETGKTEAWVVLETGSEGRIYSGLKPGPTRAGLRRALANAVGVNRSRRGKQITRPMVMGSDGPSGPASIVAVKMQPGYRRASLQSSGRYLGEV